MNKLLRLTFVLVFAFASSASGVYLPSPPEPCMAEFEAALSGPGGPALDDFCKKNPVKGINAWDKLHPHPNSTNPNILQRRLEFDDYPSEWKKKNPFPPNDEMFDLETGGYIIKHTDHRTKNHEVLTAKAFMKQGDVVKLLDESLPGKTPDADIGGIIYDFKNIDLTASNLTSNVRNKLEDASKQGAEGVVIRIADNAEAAGPNGLNTIKEAIQIHSNSGKPIPSIIKVVAKDDLTVLTYPNF